MGLRYWVRLAAGLVSISWCSLALAAPRAMAEADKATEYRLRAVGDGYAQLQVGETATGGALGVGLVLDAPPGKSGRVEASVFYKRGTVDQVQGGRSSFGNFLLSPSSGTYSFAGSLNLFPLPLPDDLGRWGLRASIDSGKSDWLLAATATDPEVKKATVGTVGGLGAVARLEFKNPKEGNQVSFVGHAMLTMRTIRGDAGNDSDFVAAVLGTRHREFYGYEVGGELRINDVYASVAYAKVGGGRIDGLTGGQLLISIGVRGGVEL